MTHQYNIRFENVNEHTFGFFDEQHQRMDLNLSGHEWSVFVEEGLDLALIDMGQVIKFDHHFLIKANEIRCNIGRNERYKRVEYILHLPNKATGIEYRVSRSGGNAIIKVAYQNSVGVHQDVNILEDTWLSGDF